MPDISEQLVEQVLKASESGTALNIQGGGSKHFLGRKTQEQAQHEVLSVAGHTGIVNYQPVELVLTARAGTPLSDIEQVLDENGQMLAFEPPRFGQTDTLGGTLACHLSGPSRPWSGSVRDHVLGTRLINGLGEHLRFGGQVMKNVAGYDISRLQAGAMGSLGVITEISLKVLPKPPHTVTLVQEINPRDAITLMNERAGVAKPINAACWLGGRLYTRLAGAESAVEATVSQWGGERLVGAEAFWQQLRDQQLDHFGVTATGQGGLPLWRFSVNPSATLFDLSGKDHCDAEQQVIDWGGAQRWLWGESDIDTLKPIAEAAGGEVSQFRGVKENQPVYQALPAPIQTIQKRLKQRFDPQGIFNPGRSFEWL